jgi:hypoxanthine phosphoribosyltransferase
VGVCSLLDKIERRVVDVTVDYVGFAIPDLFVVGYGFDVEGAFRGLPDIHVLEGDGAAGPGPGGG